MRSEQGLRRVRRGDVSEPEAGHGRKDQTENAAGDFGWIAGLNDFCHLADKVDNTCQHSALSFLLFVMVRQDLQREKDPVKIHTQGIIQPAADRV